MAAGIPFADLEDLKKGKNHLFAVGIHTYQHFNKLPNASKDVRDVAEVLAENYYFEREHIRLICDDEATKDNILEELNGLRSKIKADDRLLIYYSGHGYMDGDFGFWLPVDARAGRTSSYIRNAEIRDIILSIQARHILLISDSCFSGSLLVRSATREATGAFADWIKKPSRYVFVSGGGVVSDGKAGENSPFAAAILRELRQNNAEAINIVRLADRVTEEIRWNDDQQAELCPLFQAGHRGGQFVFLKKQTEREDWETALKNNWESGFSDYLNKYPDGQFVKEANQKLVELADDKEWRWALSMDAVFAYLQYLRKYPAGLHADEARKNLDRIKREEEEERKAAALERERERLAQIEAKRIESERLARIEAEKKERERLAQAQAEQKERERLAQIEAVKKESERVARIEAEKNERERLAKIEADQKERERLAQLETKQREADLLAFVETQQKERERERLAQIEADKQERARLAQTEADKKERERIAQLQTEKNERERLGRLEIENKERQRLSEIAARERVITEPVPDSLFKTYQTQIIGGVGVGLIFLAVWYFMQGPSSNSSNVQTIPTTQKTDITTTKSAQNDPAIKYPSQETTTPSSTTTADPVSDQTAKTDKPTVKKKEVKKQASSDNTDYTTSPTAESVRLAPAKPNYETANMYLQRALSFITREKYQDAAKALDQANQQDGLPGPAKMYIARAKSNITREKYAEASQAIEDAKTAMN